MSTEPTPRLAGPLAGYLVVDLSRALAGPHAGMMLADLGARVIKVETPGTGDDTRGWGPPFVDPEDDPRVDVLPVLQPQQGIDRPGSEERRRADSPSRARRTRRRGDRELPSRCPGPARVLRRGRCTSSTRRWWSSRSPGSGTTGPKSRRPGYDQILQGEAGMMSLTGSEPGRSTAGRRPIADLLSGMYGALRRPRRAAANVNAPAAARLSAPACSAALIGVHAFQGTRPPWRGRFRGPGQPPPLDRPLRSVPLRTAPCRSRGQREALAHSLPSFGLDADAPDLATNPERVRHRDDRHREVEQAFARLGRRRATGQTR